MIVDLLVALVVVVGSLVTGGLSVVFIVVLDFVLVEVLDAVVVEVLGYVGTFRRWEYSNLHFTILFKSSKFFYLCLVWLFRCFNGIDRSVASRARRYERCCRGDRDTSGWWNTTYHLNIVRILTDLVCRI